MMSNELLLVLNLIFVYGSVVVWHFFFKERGLYAWTVLATIAANIEVMILIDAFGVQQTLGNILFASTFLVTDILSELYGKREADRAVNLGIASSLAFVLMSQLWLLYTPAEGDLMFQHVESVFAGIPRIIISSLIVYGIVQKFDVWLYHRWWAFTSRKCGNNSSYLWLRNNGSTLVSQLLNTILFTYCAFFGVYPIPVLHDIIIFSYVIFIITSLLDTPVIYLVRYLHKRYDN